MPSNQSTHRISVCLALATLLTAISPTPARVKPAEPTIPSSALQTTPHSPSPLASRLSPPAPRPSISDPQTNIKVPPGFVVTKFAGDELAHDIFCLTTDPAGQIIVAGPGYIKRLLDTDNDGQADQAQLISNLPKGGAHGLCWAGETLLATGDNQLQKLSDANGDGVFDKAEKWADLKTTEHGGNNIVRGPDGWFYVACGNDTGVTAKFATTPNSPIKQPIAGAIVRFSPDGKQSEIVADGFRNPYGLDFDPQGRLWTFDSDNERDQFLPWYCPCRVFEVQIGRSHGWVNGGWQNGWNQPECWPSNVPRHREIGRGSPTGVVGCGHWSWPIEYWNKLFVACWSLGRIYIAPREWRRIPDPHAPLQKEEIFLQGDAGAMLAIVGMVIDPAGDMYVAVGGRKTQGSVYRVRSTEAEKLNLDHDGQAKRQQSFKVYQDSCKEFGTPPRKQPEDQRLSEVFELQAKLGSLPNHKQPIEVFQAYSIEDAELKAALTPENKTRIEKLSQEFPAESRNFNLEAARLFAMARVDQVAVPEKLLELCTPKSRVEDDLHYLIALACLPTVRSESVTHLTANALLNLQRKMREAKAIPSRNWPLRVEELSRELLKRDPRLAAALTGNERLLLPEQILFVNLLPEQERLNALRAMLKRWESAEDAENWTAEVLQALRHLPSAERLTTIRQLWNREELRDGLIPLLALKPQSEDRANFVAALASLQPNVVRAAAGALKIITAADPAHPPTPADTVAVLTALRSLFALPGEAVARRELAQIYCQWQQLPAPPKETAQARLAEIYAPLFAHFKTKYPNLAVDPEQSGADWAAWQTRAAKIEWAAGDAARGKLLFEKWQCARCHIGAGHLGPDLKGAAQRFNRVDLLATIVDPNRDIAPTFQTKLIQSPDGQTAHGIVVYESPETTLVMTANGAIARLTGVTPAMIQPSRQSLMPVGLLNQASDDETADLLKYLEELR